VNQNDDVAKAVTLMLEYDFSQLPVMQGEREVKGVVTSSDLSLQFQTLAEPFLLLREIELHIRRVVKGRITAEDFCVLDTPLQQNRQLQEIEDLSPGEYVKY